MISSTRKMRLYSSKLSSMHEGRNDMIMLAKKKEQEGNRSRPRE